VIIRTIPILLLFCLGASVLSAAGNGVSDDVLTDQVKMKLANDRDVGAAGIEVKVSKGVVELTGNVRKEATRVKAERLAKKVKGVKSVVNQLKISQTG
jgi:hyperosmotically inducible protein